MPLRLRLHRQRLASGRTVWRSRLASRLRVSLLPSRPPRRRKHGTLPRFAASRRRSCCLPRRRRRWTRLCGRSSQRHPPTPPTLPTSHLSSLPLQPLLPRCRRRRGGGVPVVQPGRAGPGRAGCVPAEPGRMWSGRAGQGRILFATSPQLHRHANRRRRRRPSDAAEEERNPRAGAAPQSRIKFALGLMIVCSRFVQSSM